MFHTMPALFIGYKLCNDNRIQIHNITACKAIEYEGTGWVGVWHTHYPKLAFVNSAVLPANLTKVLCGFSQSVLVNDGIVPCNRP